MKKVSTRESDSGRYLEYKHFGKENDGISGYSKKVSKAREIGNTSYELWYRGIDKNRIGVRIIVELSLKDKVVEVKRVGDGIIVVRLVWGKETINVNSTYVLQIRLDVEAKPKFCEDMANLVQGIPGGKRLTNPYR